MWEEEKWPDDQGIFEEIFAAATCRCAVATAFWLRVLGGMYMLGVKGGIDMTFGEKIQKLRKEAGLSQEELSYQLGVSRQAVSKWERGGSLR